MKAKKGFDLCVICLQTRTNCWYFKRLIFENMCFELWMLLCSQLRNRALPLLTNQQGWNMVPILTTLIQLERCSPPVPDHYHNEHLPAHWSGKGSIKGGRGSISNKVDFSLMWQLLLTRKPYGNRCISSLFLRASSLIRSRSALQPRRLLIAVREPARSQNPIAAAVLQHFPRAEPQPIIPICSITLEVPKHPGRVVPCGHTFSFQAIEQWASQHPAGQAPCPNCRHPIERIEQTCLPLPVDHRRLHESTYLLWLSALPVARPVPSFRRQESEITRWLLRHSLFFSNPGAQEMIRQRQASPR